MPTSPPPSPSDPPDLGADQIVAAIAAAWADVRQAASSVPPPSSVGEVGSVLEAARRLAVLDRRAKCLCVIALVLRGHDWYDVAARVGMPSAEDAEQVYGEAVARWRGGDRAPWLPRVRNGHGGVARDVPGPVGAGGEVT